jgi:hypothetical protein
MDTAARKRIENDYYKGFAKNDLPDSGERSEFSTGAVRDASYGKGIPSAIPPRALIKLAKRFEDGAAKYKRDNWKQGIPISRYVDSLYRHLWAFMEGDESEDHLGAVIWNAVCLSETYDMVANDEIAYELYDI